MINQQQVLQDEDWSKINPLGMRCQLLSRTTLDGEAFETVELALYHSGSGKFTNVEITIPTFNGNVIEWRNSKKALMYIGQILVDAEFEVSMKTRDESEQMDVHIVTPGETAIRRISDAIASALRNWFYDVDEDYDNSAVQVRVDQWFANGDEWRVLKYSDIAQEDQNNGLIIINPTEKTTHIERMMAKIFNGKLWNLIDMNSTSFGDKANESFRFVEGVTVEEGKLVESRTGSPFCSVLSKHAIGLGMNPKRAYLLRNTFEQVIDLVSSERPLVTPYEEGETNVLHGLNLLTAVMHLEHYTHEDSIAISKSAANKMIASRIVTQLVESDLTVNPLIKEGDPVSSSTPIAVDGDKTVLASKLYMPGVVEKISISKGKRFGVETNRIWFKFRSFYNLENGDKLSNRHGGKGVVVVVPDEEMPWDSNTQKCIEVCISPESIINRRAMSIMWEMMLGIKATQEQQKEIKVSLYEQLDEIIQWPSDENHNFKELAKKFGNKVQLSYKGKDLPEMTFVGPLFWMRLDKIAKEIVSSVGRRSKKNSFDAVIDSAKTSGQRCNAAKILALEARGASAITKDIIQSNMSGTKFFRELIDATRNQQFRKGT